MGKSVYGLQATNLSVRRDVSVDQSQEFQIQGCLIGSYSEIYAVTEKYNTPFFRKQVLLNAKIMNSSP